VIDENHIFNTHIWS